MSIHRNVRLEILVNGNVEDWKIEMSMIGRDQIIGRDSRSLLLWEFTLSLHKGTWDRAQSVPNNLCMCVLSVLVVTSFCVSVLSGM